MINSLEIMITSNENTSGISDNEKLINKIKILSQSLKQLEKEKKYSNANEIIDKIISLINTRTKDNLNRITDEYLKLLNTLLNSYKNKKSSYEYLTFVDDTSLLIKQKMTEKYLGKRRQTNIPITNNASNLSEYEFVPATSHSNIIKDIIEMCQSLIKYYEIRIESNGERNMKNLKTLQTFESFFIYDYHNTTTNLNKSNLIDKYIEEVKFIKSECEKIIDSDSLIDISKIKNLDKQISIIKEEFQKIYPKYQNLKEILQKNNLVRPKVESNK